MCNVMTYTAYGLQGNDESPHFKAGQQMSFITEDILGNIVVDERYRQDRKSKTKKKGKKTCK